MESMEVHFRLYTTAIFIVTHVTALHHVVQAAALLLGTAGTYSSIKL
jgi:hypothetical protein